MISKLAFAVFLILLSVAGCKKDEPTAPSAPEYDGIWVGSTSQGKWIAFHVSNNVVNGISVWFEIQTPGCIHIVTLESDSIAGGIAIIGNTLSWTRTSPTFSYTIKGTLNSSTSALGTLNFTSTCGAGGSDSATWTAAKYTAGGRGSIYVSSMPAGARIATDQYFPEEKITPDTLKNLLVGRHSIHLSRSGYRDTTIEATISENQLTNLSVLLRLPGWYAQIGGTGTTLYGVSFTDANTGTAVGDGGTILRTTNGGASWISQASGTTSYLRGVSFTDANTGTVVGWNYSVGGVILRTTDGGATWVSQTGGESGQLQSVSFTDANTGTAVGWNGRIFRTTNGGASWISQASGTSENLQSVSFTDANTGTAVGWSGTILRTTNGGALWTSQISGTTSHLISVFFTDANTGTAVGWSTILHTTNDGTTWINQTPPTGVGGILNGVFFTDANTGTAVGTSGTILRTTNGGATWTEQQGHEPSEPGATLYAVSFTDANNGTAVGDHGTILRTTTGGN